MSTLYNFADIPADWFHDAREVIARDGLELRAAGGKAGAFTIEARLTPKSDWGRLLCKQAQAMDGFATAADRDAALAILLGNKPLPVTTP